MTAPWPEGIPGDGAGPAPGAPADRTAAAVSLAGPPAGQQPAAQKPGAQKPGAQRPAVQQPAARWRPRWPDVACLGGLVLGVTWYLALIPVIPALLGTHPVLLEALNGSLPAMIAAGAFARIGRTSLVLALAAPVAGLAAFDPFWWWAGRRYGEGIMRWLAQMDPRAGRGVQRGLGIFQRYGGWALVFAYYLPAPNTVLYAAAGWARIGFLRFALLDLAGTLLRIVVVVGLGYGLGRRAAHAATLISHYALAATIALVAGTLLAGWVRRRLARDAG